MAGKSAACDFLSKQNARLVLAPLSGGVASDPAYAYGEYQLIFPAGKTEKGFYLPHIRKRENKGSRIALDLRHLLAEAPKAKTEKTVSGEKKRR
jgi:hypothetical protein